MHRPSLAIAALLVPCALAAQQQQQQQQQQLPRQQPPADLAPRVDRLFARFDAATPGCAVGLAKDGRALLTRGYGAANLEYRVPLSDSSVMESGSVAKQFTAAALVLLEQDGRLSLDDDIRKHLPEVPDFGHRITIRHLLTHTSGLRDQWGLLGIEGRGPGTQVHSPMTTLDLVSRQRALNFTPGSEYLYSNTGYALAAVIVQRASGKSLQQFSEERLFQPLGMRHTQWRDDFTRVVPNRATAYAPVAGGWRQDMPFTNMVGNGGLLSTMADLIAWNANLDSPKVGGPAFTRAMETPMRLTSGRTIPYALGLAIEDHDGVREVGHGGATAGYRTYLARYPDQRVSVAVWCGNASVNAGALARQVADLVLVKPARATAAAKAPAAARLTREQLARWAGVYRDPVTDQAVTLVAADSVLTGGGSLVLVPVGGDRFRSAAGEVTFGRAGARRTMTLARAGGDTSRFEETSAPATPLPMADYTGRYMSEELDVALTVVARDEKLYLRRRLGDEVELRPTYADAFQAPGLGSVRFTRDARGTVTGFGIFAGRVRDVRFTRAR